MGGAGKAYPALPALRPPFGGSDGSIPRFLRRHAACHEGRRIPHGRGRPKREGVSPVRRPIRDASAVHPSGSHRADPALPLLRLHRIRGEQRRGGRTRATAVIKAAWLLVMTGIALAVTVALLVGLAWIAVAIPVLICAAVANRVEAAG